MKAKLHIRLATSLLILLMVSAREATGQGLSIYDDKGIIKPIAVRAYEESIGRQRKADEQAYKPSTSSASGNYQPTAEQLRDLEIADIASDWPNKKPQSYRFHDGDLAAVKQHKKWGYVNSSNTLITPFIYDMAIDGNEGMAAVKLGCVQCNPKWGFIDNTGTLVIPIIFKNISHFNGGLAPVMLEDKWGFLDKAGKLVIPFQFDEVFSDGFRADYVSVRVGKKWTVIDKAGKPLFPYQKKKLMEYSNGFVSYLDDKGMMQKLDSKGEEVK